MVAALGVTRVPGPGVPIPGGPGVPIPGHGGDPLRAARRGQGSGARRRRRGPAGICPCPSRRAREVVLVPRGPQSGVVLVVAEPMEVGRS